MSSDTSKEIREMLRGIPPNNIILQVDDLPPKTLEQYILAQKEREKQRPKKHGKPR